MTQNHKDRHDLVQWDSAATHLADVVPDGTGRTACYWSVEENPQPHPHTHKHQHHSVSEDVSCFCRLRTTLDISEKWMFGNHGTFRVIVRPERDEIPWTV